MSISPQPDLPIAATGPLSQILRIPAHSAPRHRRFVPRRPSVARGEGILPGEYMKLRREAAGLSIEEVAAQLAHTNADRIDVRNEITLLEDDQPGLFIPLVMRMRAAFRFDPDIYLALLGFAQDAGSTAPRPRICTGCGCSWSDPCADDADSPCRWSARRVDSCTHCETKAATKAKARAATKDAPTVSEVAGANPPSVRPEGLEG